MAEQAPWEKYYCPNCKTEIAKGEACCAACTAQAAPTCMKCGAPTHGRALCDTCREARPARPSHASVPDAAVLRTIGAEPVRERKPASLRDRIWIVGIILAGLCLIGHPLCDATGAIVYGEIPAMAWGIGGAVFWVLVTALVAYIVGPGSDSR